MKPVYSVFKLGVILVLFIVSMPSAHAADDALWYEPSLGSSASSTLPDFLDLFKSETSVRWQKAQRRISVLMLRLPVLRTMEAQNPGFTQNTLAPFLSRTGVKFGVESDLAPFASCQVKDDNATAMQAEVAQLQAIKSAGIRISFISVQSPLSKHRTERLGCDYSLEQRVADIAWYVSNVRTGLGGQSVQFGLIDASVAKGPEWVQDNLRVDYLSDAYDVLISTMKSNALPLTYVQFDHPWEAFKELSPMTGKSSVSALHDFQVWLQGKGLNVGLILTSVRPQSEADFNTKILATLKNVMATGVNNEGYMLTSASAFPASELPEYADPSHFTMTFILNEIADRLVSRGE